MALLRSKQIYIYGLHSNRKAILEYLHQTGALEVSDLTIEDEDLKHKETAKSISQFEGFIQSIKQALATLDKYAPRKSELFARRKTVSIDKYSMKAAENNSALKTTFAINRITSRIEENAENIRRIEDKQAALKPYISLDVPMQIRETRKTYIRFGMLNGQWTEEDILAIQSELGVDVYFTILSSTEDETYIWIEYLKEHQEQVQLFMQGIALQEPTFSLSKHIPQKKIRILEDARTDLNHRNKEHIVELKKLEKERASIELLYDHLVLRKDKYDTLSKVGMTESTFLLQGYVLDNNAEQLAATLESKYNAYVMLETPEDLDKAPSVFVNNAFVRPVEGITEMYSMPGEHDVDPNPVMSFLYYMFFGMCFSDAGYGIILAIACGLLGYGNFLEREKRKTFQMFFFCGLFTTFWGIMYGSFFGNALSEFAGLNIQPLWIDPINEPLTLLIFSASLGLITVIIGLFVNLYKDWKNGDKAAAIFDSGSWIVVLLGVAVLAIGAVQGNPNLNNAGIWMMVGGLVLVIATGGRHNKNPFLKIIGGVTGIYDITGYVGDILSYSRLMALGLTTGVIGNVVNMLAPLFGELVFGQSPLMYIVAVVIFIAGHGINFGLNLLGAYVHTNRLQFVEFFGKFYEGGGRKFHPFAMRTKYYTFNQKK